MTLYVELSASSKTRNIVKCVDSGLPLKMRKANLECGKLLKLPSDYLVRVLKKQNKTHNLTCSKNNKRSDKRDDHYT